MSSMIIITDHIARTQNMTAKFSSISEALAYCQEHIEEYIKSKQGHTDFTYSTTDLALKYGMYVKLSRSHVYKWTVKEIVRDVGILYNTYNTIKHYTISIATIPNRILLDGTRCVRKEYPTSATTIATSQADVIRCNIYDSCMTELLDENSSYSSDTSE